MVLVVGSGVGGGQLVVVEVVPWWWWWWWLGGQWCWWWREVLVLVVARGVGVGGHTYSEDTCVPILHFACAGRERALELGIHHNHFHDHHHHPFVPDVSREDLSVPILQVQEVRGMLAACSAQCRCSLKEDFLAPEFPLRISGFIHGGRWWVVLMVVVVSWWWGWALLLGVGGGCGGDVVVGGGGCGTIAWCWWWVWWSC